MCSKSLILICGLLPFLCHPPAFADDDDDTATTMDAGLQWRLADATYNRREYDDAAVLLKQFAKANPDDPNALEALWRTYDIYRGQRPDPDKRKAAYLALVTAADHDAAAYATKDKERAAHADWYHAMALANEGQSDGAVAELHTLVTNFPGTSWEPQADWTLGEWQRSNHVYPDAIAGYQAYVKIAGVSGQSAAAMYRVAWCYDAEKDPTDTIVAYQSAVAMENFGWGDLAQEAIDAANRVKALGQDELSRSFALKVLDKAPQDRVQILNEARVLLGVAVVSDTSVELYPNYEYDYACDSVNIESGTKLTLTKSLSLDLRVNNASATSPYTAKFTVIPHANLATLPNNMAPAGDGAPAGALLAAIAVPDAKGGLPNRWIYNFTTKPESAVTPGLIVTRKWQQMGATWGQETIRVQSNGRWNIYITLPNNKTNVNNLSFQPNDVRDNGSTFVWYTNNDLSQGLTVNFPVELGAASTGYYPAMRFDVGSGERYPGQHVTAPGVTAESDELGLKLVSDQTTPVTLRFGGANVVMLGEVGR